MSLLTATAVPRQDDTGKLQLIVEVRENDETGRLICWGGPYTTLEAQMAMQLFTEIGDGLV